MSDDLTRMGPDDDDATRLAEAPGPTSESRPASAAPTPTTGWLSSSGAIDHGRFDPGTILGGRYRIIGRLGKGGMGEVYRADDLKLGQPVALKFLPHDVDLDPARLTQLHTEVRMARQVSHPNVCRVYDIDEVDGHTFLSMEYVDGEDLASLLRRFGRFSQERGLEIARQVCAGLAAAHERGVVHRDFKPGNVMLDGTGKVRITDFGLAGLAGESIRAGTPAYMAPEQLAGGEVSIRSDIYALGLVLYEIFTGQRALDARTLAELIRMREQEGIAPPGTLVQGLAPEIDRAIMRCLAPEPAMRPASALAVSAAMPGGDPLAAALAAGETPSPEMVAAAGGTEAVSARAAALGAAWIAGSLLLIAVLFQHVMFVNRVPTPKTPQALEDRATEALVRLGYPPNDVDSSFGLGFSLDYAHFVNATSAAADRWTLLLKQRPESLFLWRRTSPRTLLPLGHQNAIQAQNPPLNVAGMTITLVDASGRLTEFLAVPHPAERAQQPGPVAWRQVFDAAGLPFEAFSPAAPQLVPPTYADERMAWEGRLPELGEHTLRVEAAAHNGKPVQFVITGPWSRSARTPRDNPSRFDAVTSAITALVMPALMVAGALLARRNVRLGRGDRRGATRAALATFALLMASWLLGGHVSRPDVEIQRLFAAMGGALFDAGVLWLTYLGLEPYIRRYSPDSMIGWTRLIAGHWRDPKVGTDVMIGVSAGLAMTVFYAVHNLLPPLYGGPEPMPLTMDAGLLLGTRHVLAYLLARGAEGIQGAMLCVVGFVALRILLKRSWLAAIALVAVLTPVAIDGMFPTGTPWLDLAIGTALITVFVLTIVRFGLLATMAALTTHFVLLRAPITTDLSSWRGPLGLWFVGAVALAGLGGCYIARSGGRPASR